jgi:hypothetical protein
MPRIDSSPQGRSAPMSHLGPDPTPCLARTTISEPLQRQAKASRFEPPPHFLHRPPTIAWQRFAPHFISTVTMPTPQSLDLAQYVIAPRLAVPSGVSLGIALLSAAPKPAPQVVRRSATRLRDSVVALQHEWRRHIAKGLVLLATPRQADTRLDRAVRAFSMRLEALTLLHAEAGSDVETAAKAHQRLFPEGLRFLTLPYSQQWAHCDRLLSALDDDEALAADVERLAGETTLGKVRAAQQVYGDVLGITTPRATAETVSLVAPLDAVREAIVGYALQIIAMQSDDPSRLPAARKALAPIDELRAAQAAAARRPDGSLAAPVPAAPTVGVEEEGITVTPDTPVPTVEDEPATGT